MKENNKKEKQPSNNIFKDNNNDSVNTYSKSKTDKLKKELEDNSNDKENNEEKNEETKEFLIELLIDNIINDNGRNNFYFNNYESKNESLNKDENNYITNEKELIKCKIPIIRDSENKSENQFYIKISDLIKILKDKGYPLAGSGIYIYISYYRNYVFINDEKNFLDSNMLEDKKDIIRLKITNFLDKKLIDDTPSKIMNHFLCKSEDINEDKTEKEEIKIKQNDSHKRERKIGYVIKKVSEWRKLFNGYHDENGNYIKYSLDEASTKVGIPKKSLDDYLTQMRLGRKYKFDFNKNKDEVVSVLRKFVKDHEKNKGIELNEDDEN